MKKNVFLGLGSNLGDRKALMDEALRQIQKRIGPVVVLSSFIETEPFGFESIHPFLNAVVEIETACSIPEILEQTQTIERELGRVRKSVNKHYSDRPIDIDILLYGSDIYADERVQIPHPEMDKRLFVMESMVEIAPDLLHPVCMKKMREIYNELKKME